MKITFYGAAGEVTGSCNHVQFDDGTEILVDGGYFQGGEEELSRNAQKLPVDWQKISHLILTHGHLDHCGRIPIFYLQGFRGRIIATAPTRDIAEIVWRDNVSLLQTAANLANTDPFYTNKEIDECLKLFDVIDYETSLKINNDITATLVDAGHILGSSTVKIYYKGETVVFSGDLGNWPMGAVRPTVHPGPADVVVMETTYGNRTHEEKSRQKQILKSVIDKIVANKSTLLIPAFAIERSQELLRDLDDMVEEKLIPEIPVFLDSPMAISVTDLFKNYKKYLPDDLQKEYASGGDPFNFPRFKETLTPEESKTINVIPGPKIVIAGSGMMTGGRVHHHLKRVLSHPESILLIVGYQVKGTLGREIQDGAKEVQVDDRKIPVKCEIEKIEAYSAHADQKQLMEWVEKFNPKPRNIILCHGDEDAIDTFSGLVRDRLSIKTSVPDFGQLIELE